MPPAHELTLWSEADRQEQMRLDLAAANEEIRTLKISYEIRGSQLLKIKAKSQRLTSRLTNQREYIHQLHTARREKDALIAMIQGRVAVLEMEIAERTLLPGVDALWRGVEAFRTQRRGFIADSVVDASLWPDL